MNARTNVQIINGADGKPAFVVIPYAEYAKLQSAESDEPFIPHEVVERMVMEDMRPVRAWREHLGITQAEMAERLGITQSAYSQQEAAPKNRKATRDKIAAALGIQPSQLDV
jgi:DNA-binding XRE family transcriptional regulator